MNDYNLGLFPFDTDGSNSMGIIKDETSSVSASASPPDHDELSLVSSTGTEGAEATQAAAAAAAAAKRIKSCAPCRLRRVKCERPPGEMDCSACTLRNLPCTPMPKKPRAKVISREGKRIQQARAIFGEVDSSNTPTSDPIPSTSKTATSTPSESEVESSRLTALIATLTRKSAGTIVSPTGSEARLATHEVQGALSASLIDVYCRETPAIALLDEINLKTAFEAVGRRMNLLSDQFQVLCKTILALGARTSDHPLLIGTSAPRVSELAALAKHGKDLREYGARRESACRVLLQDALKLADEKGTLRTATPEAVTTLLVLEGLLDHIDLEDWSSHRPYSNAYNGHAKALIDKENHIREVGGVVNQKQMVGEVARWTAFVRDSMASAYTGQSPRFSEDDIFIMLQDNEFDTPLAEVVRKGDLPNKIESFWHLFGCFMFHMCTLARQTASKLTGPRARRQPLDLAFTTHYLEQVEIAENAMPHLLRRADLLEGAFEQLGIGKRFELVAMHTLVRNFRVNLYYMYLLLAKIVRERIAARMNPAARATIYEVDPWPGVPDSRPAAMNDDESYWSRVLLIRKQLERKSFYGIRAIVAVLEETIELDLPLGMDEWLDIRGIQILFSRLPLWTKTLVDVPVAEQDGPFPDWTFAAKLADLGTILKSLHSVGWQSEKLARSADWVNDEIRGLKMKQYEYWQRLSVATLSASNGFDLGTTTTTTTTGQVLTFAASEMSDSPALPPGSSWGIGQEPTSTVQSMTGEPEGLSIPPEPALKVWTDEEIQKFLDDAAGISFAGGGGLEETSVAEVEPGFMWTMPNIP